MRDLILERGRPLRVTCLIGSLKPNGAERELVAVADWLDAHGASVEIVTVEAPRGNDLVPSAGVRHRRVDVQRGRRQMVRRALLLPGTRRALLANKPHVVLAFLTEMNVAALLLLIGSGVPAVVSERVDFRHHDVGSLVDRLRRVTYGRADAVVVQTQQLARWVETHTRWPVTIVPNDVVVPPAARAPDWLAGDRRTLLAMGRLTMQKGFDVLLEAFGELAARHPDWDLVIAGEGGERTTLEATRRRLGLDSRVHLPGRVDPPWGLVGAADLFVLASRYEGFPNALAEAMAAGVPAVATDCPTGPRDLIRPGIDGVLVPVADIAALAGALDAYMGDDGLRAAAGARAREVADRYAPDLVLPRWGRLLLQAAEGRGPRPRALRRGPRARR